VRFFKVGGQGFDARAAGAARPARRSRARTGEAGTHSAHSATTRARRRRPRVVDEWAERDSNDGRNPAAAAQILLGVAYWVAYSPLPCVPSPPEAPDHDGAAP
jgi:hypothetical protein